MRITLDRLRRYAVARSLFKPTTLGRAIQKLGFVQADPIRAPARAQDLTLRHRVAGYCAGDLERRYTSLPIEEDFFVNYGFLPRKYHTLMHPRTPKASWPKKRASQAQAVLEFIRARGTVHPRTVDAHFAHGKVTNWFGGSSNATTRLLDEMHYRGLLRIARREGGTRLYAVRELEPADGLHESTAGERFDALIDVVMNKYAPLPRLSLGRLVSLLGGGVPQWQPHRAAALARAKQRFAHARVDGIDWYWPGDESPASRRWRVASEVRLLTPFDPIVWDRHRFTLLWNWVYRFEAYTPAPKRKLGYYALPLLREDQVIGWGNLRVVQGSLQATLGYSSGNPPRDPAFGPDLAAELGRLERFLKVPPTDPEAAPSARTSPVRPPR
jgi:uncharacterized protein YcaQ